MKNNPPPKKAPSKALLIIFCVVIGFIAGFFVKQFFEPSDNQKHNNTITELRAGGYTFINPLLECDNYRASNLRVHARLESNLNTYINRIISEKKINHISVYYRDLNNGPWMGINEHYVYTPASLIKVPIMIGVLKMAEKDTTLLEKKLEYKEPFELYKIQNVDVNQRIEPGNAYTIRQLIEYMIWYSDNEAATLLIHLIGDDAVTQTILDMGINLTHKEVDGDFISVKDYSSFFRVMYNASYLSREMSEYALEILSKTTFNNGIPARLPKDILVSHKFGERDLKNTGEKQLHDCGIVYVPGSPYLLCVMTKGRDFDTLAGVIAEVSEIVYNTMAGK